MELQLSRRTEAGEGPSAAEELARVMTEITEALHGAGAALTLHPADRPAEVIYSHAEEARATIGTILARGLLDWRQEHENHHIWIAGDFAPHAPLAIALPVRQVSGHSRLVITVFFDTLDAERRAMAEAAYLQRRPFAVGYFRLWQQDRLQRRDVDTLRSALDRVGTAIMLITKLGELAFANYAARALLTQGAELYERSGRLHARDRSANTALQVAIEHVIDASDTPRRQQRAPLLTVERAGMAPLTVSVMPVPYRVIEGGEIAASVFVVDPDMDVRELARPACTVFGLTRVETELTCLLAAGKTIQEASDAMRVKAETGRGYLRSIFVKTGVNRQADLVRIILTSLVRTSDQLEYEVFTLRR